MSVLAKCNLTSGIWTFESNCEYQDPVIQIGFTSNSASTKFIDLKFGFQIVKDTQLLFEFNYPAAGIVYVESDQKYLISQTVLLRSDDTVDLKVWVKNDGKSYKDLTTFTVPRPPKPFESWIWKNELWCAPVPCPEDKIIFYTWNDANQCWIPIED